VCPKPISYDEEPNMQKNSSNVTISRATLLQALAIADENASLESIAINALEHAADELTIVLDAMASDLADDRDTDDALYRLRERMRATLKIISALAENERAVHEAASSSGAAS